ncbi:alkyl sulfatase dimerization domain-containing protein [Paraburkholderia phenazinium]|uniref:Alkyl sulfatase BDS1, metallo-beta-lactamase superfamily n=1 Tax=Paraburkholderia phenazinium TaxID=60549 RepID=A0A1N6L3Y0_9BURK|nr:alkyl sulfatase dimerization domain-containing protein [Paraburkholderia phenazinium]SIO63471.1 Alkyl sulfatase BDS1, metallo-beta-lactamase superfamily [Paraburkholderia phenazinium]
MTRCCPATVRNPAFDAPHVGEPLDVAFDAGVNLAFAIAAPTVPPRLTEHSRRMAQRIYRVAERVYCAVGYAIANIIFVVGDDGIVVVDATEAVSAAKRIYEDFCAIDPRHAGLPVKAVVYTHNHTDHTGGVRAFVDEAALEAGRVEIIAHRTLMDTVINNANLVAPILATRSAYSFGTLLPAGATGKVNAGIGPVLIAEPASFFAPTRVFDDALDIELAGVRFQFRYAPSEADDEIVMWLPDLGVLLSAEVIQGECLANVHTLRGTRYRDPVRWYQTIDMMRGFGAVHMVPAHGRPVSGATAVAEVLTVYRDAIQFIHDQTIRHMNFGMTPDELAEAIPALPPHLAQHAWLGEYYGTVKHSVRQVYSGQLGWFDGDPASLDPLPRGERARRTVEMMGGTDTVRAAARVALGDGDWRWAAELATLLVRLDIDDADARSIKAEALRELGYRTENTNWRNWYLSAARELERAYEDLPFAGSASLASTDVLRAQPLRNVFQRFSVCIDPARCADLHATLVFRIADRDEAYALELRRGVLQVHERAPATADLQLALDTATLYGLLRDIAAQLPAGLESGAIALERGTREQLRAFFDSFDRPARRMPALAGR